MIILIVDLQAWNPHYSFSPPAPDFFLFFLSGSNSSAHIRDVDPDLLYPQHLMNSDPDPGLFIHQIDFKTSFKSQFSSLNLDRRD